MPDPEILQPNSLEFYKRPSTMADFYHVTFNPPSEYVAPRSSNEQLLHSLNVAHSNVRNLVRQNDKLRGDQLALIKIVKKERSWRKAIFWSFLVGIFMLLLDLAIR